MPTGGQRRSRYDPGSFAGFHHPDDRLQALQLHGGLRVHAGSHQLLVDHMSHPAGPRRKNEALSLEGGPGYGAAAWRGGVLGMDDHQGKPEESRARDAWGTLEEPETDIEVACLDAFHDARRIGIDQLNAHGRPADPEIANRSGKDVRGMERSRANGKRITAIMGGEREL